MDVPLFGKNVALQEGQLLAAMQQTADFKRKAKKTAVDMRQHIKQIF
jgi:hypothetical protein